MPKHKQLTADEYLAREVKAGKDAAKKPAKSGKHPLPKSVRKARKETRVPKAEIAAAIKNKEIVFKIDAVDSGAYRIGVPKFPSMPCPNCKRQHTITPKTVGFMCGCSSPMTTVWLTKKGFPSGK